MICNFCKTNYFETKMCDCKTASPECLKKFKKMDENDWNEYIEKRKIVLEKKKYS